MAKVIIGKKYNDFLEKLYEEYLKNKEKYKIKEKSRFDLYHRNCPFCLYPSISGFIEITIENTTYHPHLDCIKNGWINILERKLNQI